MSDKNVSFTGLSLDEAKVKQIVSSRQVCQNMTSWTRMVIQQPQVVPGAVSFKTDIVRNITMWIEKNCSSNFFIGKFWTPSSKGNQHFLVLRFEDNKDAVLFKLQDIEQIASQEHF
jgi:hypothetical protein